MFVFLQIGYKLIPLVFYALGNYYQNFRVSQTRKFIFALESFVQINLQLFSLLEVANELRQFRFEIESRWKPCWRRFESRFDVISDVLRFGVTFDVVSHSPTNDAKQIFDRQNVFKRKLVDSFGRSHDAELPVKKIVECDLLKICQTFLE